MWGKGKFYVETVGGGAVDVRDTGIFHGRFSDEGGIAGDDEADALAGVKAGGVGEFKFECGIGGGADDAGVVAVGEEVEEFDGVRGGGVREAGAGGEE